MKINTHRQHGRIVQSHHRILCNNSNCRRSSLLSSLSLSRALALSIPPLTLPRFFFLSPSLCHLTSSVSLVCLTDSKSPSLCPRSLCLPCQSPPSLPFPSLPSRFFPCLPTFTPPAQGKADLQITSLSMLSASHRRM